MHMDSLTAPKPTSREALLDVALDSFGRRGFDGASTRAIAKAAGMPMSQITYHFGGKQGLYLACAQMVADRMRQIVGPAALRVEAELDGSAAQARAGLGHLLGALVEVMTDQGTMALSRFVMREQAEPTEAFAILYGGAITRALELIARMLAQVSGTPVTLDMRLRAITLFGQVVVFRAGHAGVLAFTGWQALGAAEVELVRRMVLAQVEAVCDALQGDCA